MALSLAAGKLSDSCTMSRKKSNVLPHISVQLQKHYPESQD